jgi:tRNA1Val (adenine37-N6)-methyltransferase
MAESKPFKFKQFNVFQDQCTMKIGTDGVLLGSWAEVQESNLILDIGTGTGVIAIMMAQRNDNAKIYGVEIDTKAFLQAKDNFEKSPWANNLVAVNKSIQDFQSANSQKFDLIVSNPPFFSGGTFSHNENKNNVRQTIKLSHSDLLRAVNSLLSNEGKFSVILPWIEGLRFMEIAKSYMLYCNKIVEVIPKPKKPVERMLLTFEKVAKDVEKSTLIIQPDNAVRNQYSEEYTNLTKEFYTIM